MPRSSAPTTSPASAAAANSCGRERQHPPVQQARGQHQHVGGEAVAADVAALPDLARAHARPAPRPPAARAARSRCRACCGRRRGRAARRRARRPMPSSGEVEQLGVVGERAPARPSTSRPSAAVDPAPRTGLLARPARRCGPDGGSPAPGRPRQSPAAPVRGGDPVEPRVAQPGASPRSRLFDEQQPSRRERRAEHRVAAELRPQRRSGPATRWGRGRTGAGGLTRGRRFPRASSRATSSSWSSAAQARTARTACHDSPDRIDFDRLVGATGRSRVRSSRRAHPAAESFHAASAAPPRSWIGVSRRQAAAAASSWASGARGSGRVRRIRPTPTRRATPRAGVGRVDAPRRASAVAARSGASTAGIGQVDADRQRRPQLRVVPGELDQVADQVVAGERVDARRSGGWTVSPSAWPSGWCRGAGTAHRRARARCRSAAARRRAPRPPRGGAPTADRRSGSATTGLVDAPVLATGDLQDEDVVDVVVRREALVLRRGDVGVDLHRMAQLARLSRAANSTSGGQVRCSACRTSVAPSARAREHLVVGRLVADVAPAPPPRVKRAGGSTVPSLAIRRKGVRRPRRETSSSTAAGVEQVVEPRRELGAGLSSGALPQYARRRRSIRRRRRPRSVTTAGRRSPAESVKRRRSAGAPSALCCQATGTAVAGAAVGTAVAAVRPRRRRHRRRAPCPRTAVRATVAAASAPPSAPPSPPPHRAPPSAPPSPPPSAPPSAPPSPPSRAVVRHVVIESSAGAPRCRGPNASDCDSSLPRLPDRAASRMTAASAARYGDVQGDDAAGEVAVA